MTGSRDRPRPPWARSRALARLTTADAATVLGASAHRLGGLAPAWPGARTAGPAATALAAPRDNLALHRALALVRPGDVIVADAHDDTTVGVWGELMAIAARSAGLAGVVVAGAVRDVAALRRLAFPVFCLGTAPHPAAKRVPGELDVPIVLSGVRIEPDDLVVADDDGVVVVAAADVPPLLDGVRDLRRRERAVARRLRRGEPTIDVLGLPRG